MSYPSKLLIYWQPVEATPQLIPAASQRPPVEGQYAPTAPSQDSLGGLGPEQQRCWKPRDTRVLVPPPEPHRPPSDPPVHRERPPAAVDV